MDLAATSSSLASPTGTRRFSEGFSPARSSPSSPSKKSKSVSSDGLPVARHWSDAASIASPAFPPKSPSKSRTISLDLLQSERSGHRNAITETPDLTALSETARSGQGGRRRRFNMEELTCFKRLPSPSSLCGWKAEVYWQCTGQVRMETCSNGFNTLPLGKGRFYTTARNGLSLPELHQTDVKSLTSPPEKAKEEVQPLPEETPTAIVLEKIFPRNQQKQANGEKGNSRRPTRYPRNSNRMTQRQSAPLLPRNAAALGKERPRTATPENPPAPPARTGSRERERGRPRSADKTKPSAARIDADSKMVQFRKMILDKFPTMTKAFRVFNQDTTDGQRDLTRWEFSRFLTRHLGGLSREEHIKIFEFLDTDKNGMISISEFHTAVEAAAPVKTMEDFRRKLVALGWNSMRQALHAMEAGRSGTRRMSLQEFGAALSKAGINDETEHQYLFTTIVDPHNESGTVSLNELASAISAVSPSLLLEDIRGRVLSKYENLTQAYNGIDINATESVDFQEFVRAAVHSWKMSVHEADKSFVLMDHHRRRWIARGDFETALRLAEPSLMLEEVRWKVRQRFRSILEALQRETIRLATGGEPQEQAPEGAGGQGEGASHEDGFVSPGTAKQVLMAFKSAGIDESSRYRAASHWCKLLEPVQLSEVDTKMLCDLMDVSRNGLLSAAEFERGLRLFAPSVILEDLRCSCLRNHVCVADAFATLPQDKRHIPLDADGMTKVLHELDLHHGIQVQAIIDLIEPNRDGGLTVSELIAALQCTAPGVQVRLPTAQRNAQAREKVHSTMAPFHKSATELRAHVRQKPPAEGDELIVLGTLDELRAQETGNNGRQNEGHPAHPGNNRSVSTPPMNVKQSYSKVRCCLERTTDHTPILERVRGYYSNAGNTTANDEKLLSRKHSRFKHFQKSTGHYEVLTRPLV